MCTGGRHPRRPHVPHAGLLDRRDPASVHCTEHCLVADFLFSCTWQEKKPTTNNGDRHSRRPKRGALQRRCRSGGGGPPSPPAAANSLCFVLGRGCVRLCPPSHPAGRLGWAGLGWVWCVCGGAGLWWPKSHPQPTTSLPVRSEPQAGAAASKHPQQAEESSRRCNFTSPQAFGSPSPTSPSAHLVCGRRAGETLPHTPPHRRGRDGAQQRGRFRERSGVRGIEEEPRSPLAVAIGRIILDVGRRSKPSFPLGAACAEPPCGPCVDRTRWRE